MLKSSIFRRRSEVRDHFVGRDWNIVVLRADNEVLDIVRVISAVRGPHHRDDIADLRCVAHADLNIGRPNPHLDDVINADLWNCVSRNPDYRSDCKRAGSVLRCNTVGSTGCCESHSVSSSPLDAP